MIITIIILGLFMVYVFNMNSQKPPTSQSDLVLSMTNTSPTSAPLPTQIPTQNQIANITPSQPSSSPSQIESATAVIKTSKGNIEISFYSKDAPNTVANFVKLARNLFGKGFLYTCSIISCILSLYVSKNFDVICSGN